MGTISVESDSESEEELWGPTDGSPPPSNDPQWEKEDMKWRKFAVGKYVYFRWSTAFNSKNRFKGIVTEHASRCGGKNGRFDFLTIKTFGISEDRYRMGKDIRELLVLPNKASLMESNDEEELKLRAVRRWSARDGWTDSKEALSSSASTQASTPLATAREVKPRKKIIKLPLAIKKVAERKTFKKKTDPDGVYITAVHRGSSVAGTLLAGRFCFYN